MLGLTYKMVMRLVRAKQAKGYKMIPTMSVLVREKVYAKYDDCRCINYSEMSFWMLGLSQIWWKDQWTDNWITLHLLAKHSCRAVRAKRLPVLMRRMETLCMKCQILFSGKNKKTRRVQNTQSPCPLVFAYMATTSRCINFNNYFPNAQSDQLYILTARTTSGYDFKPIPA